MTSHFEQRCVERGIVKTDHRALFTALRLAIAAHDKGRWQTLVELVMTHEDARFWRFRCADGIFYAVTALDNTLPMTIFTQRMLNGKKRARRTAAKKHKDYHHGPKLAGRAEMRRASGWNWRDEVAG